MFPNETIKLEAGYLYLIPSFTTCNYQFNEELSHIYKIQPILVYI